jgi:hypothetical protein
VPRKPQCYLSAIPHNILSYYFEIPQNPLRKNMLLGLNPMTMTNYLLQLIFPNEAMKCQKLTIHFTSHPNHNIRSARNCFRCFRKFKSPCADIACLWSVRASSWNMASIGAPVLRFGRLVAENVVNIGKYGSTRFVKRLSSFITWSCTFGKKCFHDIAYWVRRLTARKFEIYQHSFFLLNVRRNNYLCKEHIESDICL